MPPIVSGNTAHTKLVGEVEFLALAIREADGWHLHYLGRGFTGYPGVGSSFHNVIFKAPESVYSTATLDLMTAWAHPAQSIYEQVPYSATLLTDGWGPSEMMYKFAEGSVGLTLEEAEEVAEAFGAARMRAPLTVDGSMETTPVGAPDLSSPDSVTSWARDIPGYISGLVAGLQDLFYPLLWFDLWGSTGG